MRAFRLALSATVFVALTCTSSGLARATGTSAACPAHWANASLPAPTEPAGAKGGVNSMTALSPTDIWALLRSDTRLNPTYIEHYDGTSWQQIANPGTVGSTFTTSVLLASSDSNVWAVGESETGLEAWQYDGTSWTDESPDLPPSAEPADAVLDSQGDLYIAASNFATNAGLIWERTGTHWTDLTPASPLPSYTAITLTPTGTLVGVGDSTTIQELTSGTWTTVTVPGASASLNDVAAAADGTVFAVGQGASKPVFAEVKPGAATAKTFPVAVPVPAATGATFELAVTGPGDVWLFNSYDVGGYQPWIDHFDGQQVSRATTPAYDSSDPALNGGLVLGPEELAYGSINDSAGTPSPKLLELCPIQVSEQAITPGSETVPTGAQTFWSLPDAGRLTSPGLFDTGKLPAGSSFEYAFFAAATYAVQDKTTGMSSTVKVKPAVTPAAGETGTVFHLTVAKSAAPVGYSYRVLIKRPRSAGYVTLTTTTHRSISFIPANAGKFSFEAELKTPSGVTAASPPVTATVGQ